MPFSVQLVHIRNPLDKLKYFERLRVESDSWLVADLKVKFDLQMELLQKADGFEDTTVYRLSELWRYLFKQHLWDYELINPDLARVLIGQHLAQKEQAIYKSPRAAELTFQCLQEFVSLFADPRDLNLLADWFSENPDSLKWYGWFEAAREIFWKFKEQKFVLNAWIPHLLLEQGHSLLLNKEKLFLDVGIHLSTIEAKLLLKIAQDSQSELVVLRPSAGEIEDRFPFSLQIYNEFKSVKTFSEVKSTEAISNRSKFRVHKLSNPIAEIRLSAHQILSWLESGVPAENIGLIAPDIESYWPVLFGLFSEVGIPTQKGVVARPVSFPQVDRWIAEAKVHIRKFSYAHLEQAYVARAARMMPFEKFYALFSSMIDDEDLAREKSVLDLFSKAWTEIGPWTAEEFAVNLMSLTSFPENFAVDSILRELLSLKADFKLTPEEWMNYLSSVLARTEVNLQAGESSGIKFLNMASAEATSLTHKIYLGLTESQVEKTNFSLISAGEIQSLARIGFYLPHPEDNHIDFDLRWSSSLSAQEQVFLYPETDFMGSVQRSCSFWVELEKKYGLLQTPSELLAGFSQSSRPGANSVLSEIHGNQFLGLDISQVKLSASSIEDYLHCPFVFAAKRVFRLLDEPIVDLQADPRSLGSLDHAILERLSPVGDLRDFSDEDLDQLFEQIRVELDLKFFDQSIWDLVKIRKLKMARHFLKTEQKIRDEVVGLKPLFREYSFEVQIEGVQFRGKIDRVDQVGTDRVWIYDYKSSTSGLSAFKSWVEKDQLQMLIYAEALRTSGYQVQAAHYFDLKKMKLLKGFAVDEKENSDLFQSPLIPSETLEHILVAMRSKIKEVSSKISEGKFAPLPKDPSDCVGCVWRTQCRAPHLN